MFQKNDSALLTARSIVLVVITLLAVGSFVAGIVLSIVAESALFVLIILGGWFFCWLLWVFARLYLSYLCDIKLIRNKLYGVSNENLAVFLVGKDDVATYVSNTATENSTETAPEVDENGKNVEEIDKKLRALKILLDSGAITQEEYDKKKKTILK